MKTGGGGGTWVAYDSPKPRPVKDPYAFWGESPLEISERCTWWLRQIDRGWRPNRFIRCQDSNDSATWYGVYIWEWINLIYPALKEKSEQASAV